MTQKNIVTRSSIVRIKDSSDDEEPDTKNEGLFDALL